MYYENYRKILMWNYVIIKNIVVKLFLIYLINNDNLIRESSYKE
jgi:hypothetical protein